MADDTYHQLKTDSAPFRQLSNLIWCAKPWEFASGALVGLWLCHSDGRQVFDLPMKPIPESGLWPYGSKIRRTKRIKPASQRRAAHHDCRA